ncbi:MAG: helix-turn-helix transcriptional regulator [Clostridiales bacterium]|nr:helix-turn-helix transcriptional regulator [Clostridiales bacterium]
MESNIRKLRMEKNNISQMELAEAIGLSQQIISRMERDRSKIQVKTLIDIADYFGVSTDEVLGYHPKKDISRKTVDESSERLQSVVYDLLVSAKRCLEESGI